MRRRRAIPPIDPGYLMLQMGPQPDVLKGRPYAGSYPSNTLEVMSFGRLLRGSRACACRRCSRAPAGAAQTGAHR